MLRSTTLPLKNQKVVYELGENESEKRRGTQVKREATKEYRIPQKQQKVEE